MAIRGCARWRSSTIEARRNFWVMRYVALMPWALRFRHLTLNWGDDAISCRSSWNSWNMYPLVNLYIAMERSTIFNGKIHYFDWAIFNSYVSHYQRVSLSLAVILNWWFSVSSMQLGPGRERNATGPMPVRYFFGMEGRVLWRHSRKHSLSRPWDRTRQVFNVAIIQIHPLEEQLSSADSYTFILLTKYLNLWLGKPRSHGPMEGPHLAMVSMVAMHQSIPWVFRGSMATWI